MSISLKNFIKKEKQKVSRFDLAVKALALEINGLYKQNIPTRIKPKTIKKKGKTLFDTGTGQKGILSLVRQKTKIETGNFYKYMGYHLTGTKHLPKRDWLITPKNFVKFIKAWQKEWIA